MELGSGDLGGNVGYPAEGPSLCGSGGSSEDILALREGCWLLVCALVLAAIGGRPVVLEPEPGEFFLFKGTGAPGVGGVTCRGFGIGTGVSDEPDLPPILCGIAGGCGSCNRLPTLYGVGKGGLCVT